jgi:predicted DNA-binding transcriptional regulator YafY
MSRGDGLARQLQLMRMLETRQEIVVPEVAAELGYTVRTVYRDLQVLERVGVPIYQDRRDGQARWRVVEGYRRKLSLTLSWPEMIALGLARKLLAQLGTTPLGDAATSAMKKISDALPREVADRTSRFEEALTAQLGAGHDYERHGDSLRTLVEAIERHETVRLQYRKLGTRTNEERHVDPYLLHVQSGSVYMMGFCHQRNAVRTFLLDRIREVARTGGLYGARVAFAPAAMVQGALGPWEGAPQRVEVRFDEEMAELAAERRIHSSQRTQWRSDGQLDVELRLPICPPLISWLLGWGQHVQVVAPASLRKRLEREHASAARGPQGSPPAPRKRARRAKAPA